MRSSRLLIIVPASTALVFAGMAPAMAGDDHHHDKDVWAEVVSIDDEAEANDDGTEVEVTFTYRCDNDDDDITTKVALKQDGAWFTYVDENDDDKHDDDYFRLACDGDEHDATVTLEDHGDDLKNGRAWAGVRFEDEDGDVLDEEWEKVTVSGVDDDDEDHHKRHRDDDGKGRGDH